MGVETDCAQAMAEFLAETQRLGLDVTQEQHTTFERYCAVLSEANERTNLTAVRTAPGIMRILFLDSLTIASALPSELTTWREGWHPRVIDVGTGAGIPGLPLKIVFPWWSLALIESVGKKARFLELAVRELDLQDVSVLPARAEGLGARPEWRDSADLCLARAVAHLPTLIELCAPFVRPNGVLAFPKSGDIRAEVESASRAARALRVELTGIVSTLADPAAAARGIVLYRKSGATPPSYPRRVGLASSRPIGNASRSRVSSRIGG